MRLFFIFLSFLVAGVIGLPNPLPGQLPAGTPSLLPRRRQGKTFTAWTCSDGNDPRSCTRNPWSQSDGTGSEAEIQGPQTPPDPNPSGSPTTTSGTADTSQTANTSPAGDNSILDTINTWRTAYEKNNLTWSQDMVAAAANSGQLSKGDPDNFHHNNPSNAAEVETPGNDGNGGKDLQGHTPFEISMISWLCEVPTGPVEGLCAFQNSIMNMCVFLTSPVSAVDRLIS